ncbi:MAG: hypothetical protein F6J97_17170 [Leptolyngbya sp. SIO4C1]|nr:hypothetical protein [Leptolyngbya sp. SIO4C1]
MQSSPGVARETVLVPIEDAPYQDRLGDCRFGPVLYGHENFRGNIHRLDRSDARFSDGNNNVAGSACVPRGWGVIIYKKKDFDGRSLRIGPGQVTTRIRDELNNDATSARIYRIDANGNWIEQ